MVVEALDTAGRLVLGVGTVVTAYSTVKQVEEGGHGSVPAGWRSGVRLLVGGIA